VWLDVKNFNLFDQVGVDIMHNILEGCAKYIMGFIISYYVKDLKLFSLQVLNDRLFAFDFGPEKNKPCTINMDHIDVRNVKQSASEMLILVRYFGLIIGDLIPIEEPVWVLYITLRKVLDIMLAHALEEGSIYLLKTLIAELNDLYLKYSNNCLKPKFHFLVHYPSMIKMFGPVSLHDNDFTVFSLNIRSIRKHFNELLVVLSSANIKFYIIMLSETWLDNNIGKFDIKGYNCYNHYSSLNISDGIKVYIKDSIIVNDVIIGGLNHCNSLDFSISYNNILIKLTCIYRSPSLNKIDFIDNLEDFLNNYSKFQSHYLWRHKFEY